MAKFHIALLLLTGVLVAWYSIYDSFDHTLLRGKSVLITGASSGIGEELAYQYAKFGSILLLVARREAELQKVVSKCHELGAKQAYYIVADLSSLAAAKKVYITSLELVKGIDIVVLNHIYSKQTKYWDMDDLDTMQYLFDVNTFSYINIATLFLPELKKSSGRLIVVSSLAGKVGITGVAGYSSSKQALHGFFDSLRSELRVLGHGVSVTVSVLGPIDTVNAKLNYKWSGDVFWYPVDECALAIVRGGALRHRQIYYPYIIKIMEISHFVFPDFIETFIQITSREVSISDVTSFPFNIIGYITHLL